VPAAILPGEAA